MSKVYESLTRGLKDLWGYGVSGPGRGPRIMADETGKGSGFPGRLRGLGVPGLTPPPLIWKPFKELREGGGRRHGDTQSGGAREFARLTEG